jgi:hypothetical protein
VGTKAMAVDDVGEGACRWLVGGCHSRWGDTH